MRVIAFPSGLSTRAMIRNVTRKRHRLNHPIVRADRKRVAESARGGDAHDRERRTAWRGAGNHKEHRTRRNPPRQIRVRVRGFPRSSPRVTRLRSTRKLCGVPAGTRLRLDRWAGRSPVRSRCSQRSAVPHLSSGAARKRSRFELRRSRRRLPDRRVGGSPPRIPSRSPTSRVVALPSVSIRTEIRSGPANEPAAHPTCGHADPIEKASGKRWICDALGGNERSAGFTMRHQEHDGVGGNTPRKTRVRVRSFPRSVPRVLRPALRRGRGRRGRASNAGRHAAAGSGGSIRTRGKDLREIGSLWFFTRHEGSTRRSQPTVASRAITRTRNREIHPRILAPSKKRNSTSAPVMGFDQQANRLIRLRSCRAIEIDPISQDGASRPEECDRVRENAEPGGGRPNARRGPSLRKTLRT